MSTTLGPLMEMARIQSEINRLFDNLLDLGQKDEVRQLDAQRRHHRDEDDLVAEGRAAGRGCRTGWRWPSTAAT